MTQVEYLETRQVSEGSGDPAVDVIILQVQDLQKSQLALLDVRQCALQEVMRQIQHGKIGEVCDGRRHMSETIGQIVGHVPGFRGQGECRLARKGIGLGSNRCNEGIGQGHKSEDTYWYLSPMPCIAALPDPVATQNTPVHPPTCMCMCEWEIKGER